jgi:hypothetical protein
MKLNLGCGSRHLPGYCNVDKHGEADQHWDLETFPWPWADNSVDEINMSHVLEHLGQQPQTFIRIMQEMYRVCRDGASVHVVVPHPRHDHFIIDPTHVRPILPDTLEMFSRAVNLQWQRAGASNTPLALYHNVDFEVVSVRKDLEEPYRTMFDQKQIPAEEVQRLELALFNVVSQIDIVLRVNKPA